MEMRDIRFRGKRKDTGKWVEGYYVCEDAMHAIMTVEKDGNSRLLWNEVDPETVGQWWNLPNMESEGVFEGDIVECGEHRGVVRLVGIRLQPFDYLSGMDISHGVKPRYTPGTKVIGNIHDNPELEQETKR